MVKEIGNRTNDSSKGGLGRYVSVVPSNALSKDAGVDSSDDGDDEEDPKEDPEEVIDGTKTQEKGVVCEG